MYNKKPTTTKELQDLATKVFSLTDLTTLNLDDTKEIVENLCKRASSGKEKAAAVCVYPEHIKTAKEALQGSGVKVATVTNFPEAEDSLSDILALTQTAINDQVDEVDLVFPWKKLVECNKNKELTTEEFEQFKNFIKESADLCHKNNVQLKVILETGELKEEKLIALASSIAIKAGADFIKTSTGKVPVSATPEAALVMLKEILKLSKEGYNCGLKISGGVKTVEQAREYLALAENIFGNQDFINAKTFRFGASGIYNDIYSILTTGKALETESKSAY